VAAAQAGGFVLTIHSPASGDLQDAVLVAEAQDLLVAPKPQRLERSV
jgi:hypothetical protein